MNIGKSSTVSAICKILHEYVNKISDTNFVSHMKLTTPPLIQCFGHVRAEKGHFDQSLNSFFIPPDAEAPKFVGEMADVAVQEGEKAKFECFITGQPVPDVKW